MIKYDHLIGIPFKYGTSDCFSLCRRFLIDNFQLDIPDYARPEGWWNEGLDLMNENFHAAGFKLLDIPLRELRVGDILMMQLDAPLVNHCAVYVGRSMILHHVWNQLSTTTPYRGPFRNRTTHMLRHKDMPDTTQLGDTIDLMTKLLPRKRRLLEAYLAATKSS